MIRPIRRTALVIGIVLIAVLTCPVVYRYNTNHELSRSMIGISDAGFVLHGKPFFLLAINYGVSLRTVGDELWPCPSTDYREHREGETVSRSADLLEFQAHMELIREMGFNTVRLVGFGEAKDIAIGNCLRTKSRTLMDTVVCLTDDHRYVEYLRAVEDLLRVVANADLKAILLVNIHPGSPSTEAHFIRIAERFKEDNTILAYDLFNEPLYFDPADRSKVDVPAISARMRSVMCDHAPHQLFTIGLTGMREVFEWDPNLIDADFISFHPYEYEPDQVRNETRWYGANVRKPWIIGETGVPADNDSVSYAVQSTFAQKTLHQALACGAKGYSWWQFKDVDWNYFHSDFMGVLQDSGKTLTGKSGLIVEGSPKPVVQDFKHFDPWADPGECQCLPNYLNYSDGKVCKVTGRLVDADGIPINEGVVLSWNERWSASHHTTSGADGRFELRAPFWLHHWMASATRHSMDRGDCDPNGFRRGSDGIPAYELGDIVLERLSFAE